MSLSKGDCDLCEVCMTMTLLDWVSEAVEDGVFVPFWYPFQSHALSNSGKYISPDVQSEYLYFKLLKYISVIVSISHSSHGGLK